MRKIEKDRESVMDMGWRCWAEHVRVAIKEPSIYYTLSRNDPRVCVYEGHYHECSLLYLADNDYLTDEEIDAISAVVAHPGDHYHGGGGAAPEWMLCAVNYEFPWPPRDYQQPGETFAQFKRRVGER